MGDNGGFVVFVYTGDKPKAGTDASISIQLFDAAGHQSDVITLDNYFSNDFERGQKDTFSVDKDKTKSLSSDGKVDYITVWKEDGWFGGDWFVDKIVVENRTSKARYVFPVFRWIRSSGHIKISHLDTCLPQNDRFRDQREKELVEKRKLYEYLQRYPGGPMKVKTIPEDEKFSFQYDFDLSLQAVGNEAAAEFIKLSSSNEWASFEDVCTLFGEGLFPKPDSVDKWREDANFGFQRVGGIYNHLISLAKEIPAKFPVTDKMVGPLLEGKTLADLLKEKRLFISDLEIMQGVKIPESRGTVVCVPIALFFVDKNGHLMPLAIQLFQEPSATNPIFTPLDDEYLWMYARMWFNNAEASVHQAVAHLGMTHLVMEGINIAANRHLSLSHPIFKLMAPHFLYLIAINGPGVDSLLVDGGIIDSTFSCGVPLMLEIIAKEFTKWRMDVDGTLPTLLKEQGLDDPKVLPEYPYRDDGMLLYNAINKYVSAYVKLYYPTTDLLTNDYEIQNWVQEIVKERKDGGVGLKGVPGNGKLTNTDDLVKIVNCVIYTSSVRHAAVNFPQYDTYSLPMNYPSWMSKRPPTSKSEKITEKHILSSIADKKRQLDLLKIIEVLSTKATRSLGDFEVQYVHDPPAMEFVNQFRKDLEATEATIKARNKDRSTPYEYLLPKEIPNAISI